MVVSKWHFKSTGEDISLKRILKEVEEEGGDIFTLTIERPDGTTGSWLFVKGHLAKKVKHDWRRPSYISHAGLMGSFEEVIVEHNLWYETCETEVLKRVLEAKKLFNTKVVIHG